MSDESPIVKAQKLLADAEKKLGQAAQLQKLKQNLYGDHPVSISAEVSNKTFGDGIKSPISQDLLRDALMAGCDTLAASLKREAESAAREAGKLLAPPPVMRGNLSDAAKVA